MSATNRQRLAKIIRVVARVLGLLVTVLYLFILIVAINLQAQSHAVPEMVGGVLVLAACVISWWRVRLAGILLILISIGIGVFVSIVTSGDVGWGIVLLPWLVSGILFLTSWWLSRKPSSPKLVS